MNIKEEHKVVLELNFGEYEKFRSIIMNITEESIRNLGLGDGRDSQGKISASSVQTAEIR